MTFTVHGTCQQDIPKVLLLYKKQYVEVSLGFLALDHPVRYICIRLTESPIFEAGVILIIITNCVVLAMFEPTKGEYEGRNKVWM